MPLYHNKWRGFLNEGVKPQLTEEEQLLAEGRLDDVKKKFPELDKRGAIDDLSAKDPSGNNAYLRWMATQLNNFYEKEAGYAQRQEYQYRIQNVAQSFHKNKQRLKKKDIYQYKTVEELLDAVEKLGASAAAKRKKEKETAMEGSEIVYENDDFFAVRPYTTDASCFYGRATRWCISATKTQNYFDQYSADGKGFVMVRLEHLADDNDEKKIALVYDRDGQLEEIFNAPDDSIDEDLWENAVAVNIIEGILEGSKYAGKGQMYYNTFFETHTKTGFDEDEKVPGIWKAIVKGIIDKYSDGDLVEPDLDNGDEVAEFIYERLQGIGKEIEYQGSVNIEENPPGPDPAAFQNILDEFEANSKHIYINFDDYDDTVYFSGGLTFEFDEIDEDEWVGDPDFGWNGDETEKVTDIAREVMDDNYIYPDEIEVDWSEGYRRNPDTGNYERTGNNNLSIRVSLQPDYNEPQTPDGFKEFADRLLGYDENYEAAKDAILQAFYTNNLLKSEALANAQQIQVELENDLKHFDEIKIGDGEITAYGDLHVQLPRIPPDFFELSRKMGTGENPGEWYDRKDGLTGIARGMKESYIDFLKNKLLRLMDDSVTRQRFKSSIGKIFKKAEEDADKQTSLDLRTADQWKAEETFGDMFEADNPYELGNFTYSTVPSQRVYHPESGKFTVPFYVEIPLRDDSLKWNMQFLRDVDRFWSLIEDAYEAAFTGMLEDFVAHNTTHVKRYLSMWDEKEAEEKKQPKEMNEHFNKWRKFLK
tara:strand:+ start:96 stop:2375 length:2280 start_codon:yes stop_codon:yes gene_type:complete